jgi:thymidylate synthase ThyX
MNKENIKVYMTEHPGESDWCAVKRRALVTMGYSKIVTPPDLAWKHSILEARHSPIRRLRFSFDITCPYWVSVHLCRHIHAQPFVRSQRNDRQDSYDRNSAPQDAPVNMIWDMNAEELMVIANKRLCKQASEETRYVVQLMCEQVLTQHPEFKGLLVPACAYNGGVCHEIYPCKNE